MSKLQNLKRFFEPLAFSKQISLKAIIPAVLNGLIWTVVLILIRDITNVITGAEQGNILLMTIFFVVLSFGYWLVIVISRNRTHVIIRPYWRQCFYKKYMKQYLQLDNCEIEKMGTGRLISIVEKGINTHVGQIVDITQNILPGLIQIIISFFFVLYVNVYYGLIACLFLIILGFVIYFQQKKADKLRRIRKELNIGVMRMFVKVLMSKFEVLSTNRGDYEIEKLVNSLDENIVINKKQMNITVRVDLLLRLFVDGMALIMILLFGFGFFQQSINIGEFASLIGIVYFLDKVLSQIKSYYVSFLKNIVDIQRLWEIFDTTKKMSDINKGKTFNYKSGNIETKNISFKYDKVPVFENLSLKIEAGNKVAFVGTSGGGKSTLIKLLSGYIKPDNGKVLIDGQNLAEIKLKDYYKHVGYLTQDPSVFDGTIYENLVYALERKPDKDELKKIIKLAKCGFIKELEFGLETEIGERGIRLSGGQKQRLAIAKIMLKNPNIIFLDEPTSALDSFNEELINTALNNLFKAKTVIIIAHRLQTVKNADRILLFEDGGVIEDGSHDELVKLDGKYKKMLDLQSGF